MQIGRFSLGMGDRFAHQAKAQLTACIQAQERGADIVPVWNKSIREHQTIGSECPSVQAAAAAAVKALGWTKPWFVDADHIRLDTVDPYVPCANFFTLDVADSIGKAASDGEISAFVEAHPELAGTLDIAGTEEPFQTTKEDVGRVARQFLLAVKDAGKIYRHLVEARGQDDFVTEISMDETDNPQTPPELLVILAAIADEGIPVQTIAPKFTGRFNKGVDYAGDMARFEKEFNDDLCVIAHAVGTYGLPENLKLSVHSGSDKFSIYAPIRRALKKHGAGVHLKTAGTTWLEECIGLAEADGEGLALAKEIYAEALANVEALCAPYAAVIDIDRAKLPGAEEVHGWSASRFVDALRHDPGCPGFNPHLRQLLHVGYKVAARLGDRYLNLLEACEESVSRNVTVNLFDRHIVPLFLAED